MNKADLIERIAIDTDIPKFKAAAALNSFTDTIVRELKNGGAVTLLGFGVFSLLKREARNARNPQTGEMMKVNEKKVAKFKPGKDFSSAIAE